MKPIAILQHVDSDGPAYFTEYLARHGLHWRLFAAFRGDALPERIEAYAGFAILGGPMSANDDLPHLRRAEELVRAAIAADVPVIGHCLGGQVMAKALGAEVSAAASPEIGWTNLEAKSAAAARRWFGGARRFVQFQWHHEAFALPPGAEWLAASACCPYQAFAVGDKHLAMQFHTEVDGAKVTEWIAVGRGEIESVARYPGVQSAARIEQQMDEGLAAARRIADSIYLSWCEGLAN
jgi:GMP synthase-like glutamine amidotransferase